MTSDKHYSLLKLFTGFINAALIAWKLIVVKAISIAKTPAKGSFMKDWQRLSA